MARGTSPTSPERPARLQPARCRPKALKPSTTITMAGSTSMSVAPLPEQRRPHVHRRRRHSRLRSSSKRACGSSTSTSTATSTSCITTASLTRLPPTTAARSTPAGRGGTETATTYGYGLNVCDVNGDGFEDVSWPSNRPPELDGVPVPARERRRPPAAVGSTARRPSTTSSRARTSTGPACRTSCTAGRRRPSRPMVSRTRLVRFRSLVAQGTASGTIRLRVVGGGGARNQQGRAVRLRPLQGPDVTSRGRSSRGPATGAEPLRPARGDAVAGHLRDRSPVHGRLGAHDGHARGGADHLRGRAGGLRPAVAGAVATRRLLPPT